MWVRIFSRSQENCGITHSHNQAKEPTNRMWRKSLHCTPPVEITFASEYLHESFGRSVPEERVWPCSECPIDHCAALLCVWSCWCPDMNRCIVISAVPYMWTWRELFRGSPFPCIWNTHLDPSCSCCLCGQSKDFLYIHPCGCFHYMTTSLWQNRNPGTCSTYLTE